MKFSDYLLSVDSITKNYISRVTVQLWEFKYPYNSKRREKLNTPFPYGTGILVSYIGLKFIFTAHHVVFNRDDSPLYIRVSNDQFISITGKVGMFDSESGVDLAYIELSMEVQNELSRVSNKGFLEARNIGFGGTVEEGDPVIAMGFPELKTKIGKTDLSVFTVGSIWLTKGAADKIYEYYKKSKSIYFCLNFQGEETGLLTTEKFKKIDPEGISGGGVWKIWVEPFLGEKLVRYHLIGILTEYNKGKYHVLWANRIEILMRLINSDYGVPDSIESTTT